ncbi:hypothetical protein KIN20_009942 [Parelaphostrongylus tenuis]|uniref:Uncharacterized protein n=1 Tax=Parelaphostrongylus tenuis TaxID=148309 RepID=A0AAD5QNR0_PARTN|nr:hypothetical protein KIN20_009942 [Parelaphostrongylus tenuis]
MEKMRSAYDPEYKTLELDISEWESVKILKRSEINSNDLKKDAKKDIRRPLFSCQCGWHGSQRSENLL